MSFADFNFVLFYIFSLALIFLSPKKLRSLMILASSILFLLSWELHHISVFLYVALLAFLLIQLRYKYKLRSIFFELSGLIFLLIPLLYFKYFISSNTAIEKIPLGLSFYTFHAISFFIDSRNERYSMGLSGYWLYITYWPQIICGPIMRAKELLPNINYSFKITPRRIDYSLVLILLGYTMKLVISDNLSLPTDQILKSSTLGLVEIAIFIGSYSIKILCDFAGYSLIAVGCSSLIGIRLIHNFRNPYFSNGIVDFWSKWHISLTNFLKTYLFKPMMENGANYKLSVMVIFLCSGIWHGNTLLFIIWGFGHATLFLIEKWIAVKEKFSQIVLKLYTFLAVSILWLPFKFNTFNELSDFLGKVSFDLVSTSIELNQIIKIILLCIAGLSLDFFSRKRYVYTRVNSKLIGTFLIAIIFIFSNQLPQKFIYFNF